MRCKYRHLRGSARTFHAEFRYRRTPRIQQQLATLLCIVTGADRGLTVHAIGTATKLQQQSRDTVVSCDFLISALHTQTGQRSKRFWPKPWADMNTSCAAAIWLGIIPTQGASSIGSGRTRYAWSAAITTR